MKLICWLYAVTQTREFVFYRGQFVTCRHESCAECSHKSCDEYSHKSCAELITSNCFIALLALLLKHHVYAGNLISVVLWIKIRQCSNINNFYFYKDHKMCRINCIKYVILSEVANSLWRIYSIIPDVVTPPLQWSSSLPLSFEVLFACLTMVSFAYGRRPNPPSSVSDDSGANVSSLVLILCSLSALVTCLIACTDSTSKTPQDIVQILRTIDCYWQYKNSI